MLISRKTARAPCWTASSPKIARHLAGEAQGNRGSRVRTSNLRGPYKGSLRRAADLSPAVLTLPAFEQVFKAALSRLPPGATKRSAEPRHGTNL